jgi:hypothetical protein
MGNRILRSTALIYIPLDKKRVRTSLAKERYESADDDKIKTIRTLLRGPTWQGRVSHSRCFIN